MYNNTIHYDMSQYVKIHHNTIFILSSPGGNLVWTQVLPHYPPSLKFNK